MFGDECFLDKSKKIVKFKSEKKIERLAYNRKVWENIFPPIKNLQYEKLMLSNIGVYSAPKKYAMNPLLDFLENNCKYDLSKMLILDSTGGNGVLSLYLSFRFKKVIVFEIMKDHYDIIQNNVNVYNRKNVSVFNMDFINFVLHLKNQPVDMIIMDPPWGGTNYLDNDSLKLGFDNVDVSCIINELLKNKQVKKAIVLGAPYNFDIQNFTNMVNSESIEIFKPKYPKQYWIIIRVE